MTEPTGARIALRPRQVVELQHAAMLELDVGGLVDLFAVDAVMEFPFAPLGTPRQVQGRDAIRCLYEVAVQRVREEGRRPTGFRSLVIHQTLDPEVVIDECEVEWEATAPGTAYGLPFVRVIRVRDGEIVLLREYFGERTADALEATIAAARPQADREAG